MLNKNKATGAVLSLGILVSGGIVSGPTALAAPGQEAQALQIAKKAADGAPKSTIQSLWHGAKEKAAYYVDYKGEKQDLKKGWNTEGDNLYYVDENNRLSVDQNYNRSHRTYMIKANEDGTKDLYSADRYGRCGRIGILVRDSDEYINKTTNTKSRRTVQALLDAVNYWDNDIEYWVSSPGDDAWVEFDNDNKTRISLDIENSGVKIVTTSSGAKYVLGSDGRWLRNTEFIAIKEKIRYAVGKDAAVVSEMPLWAYQNHAFEDNEDVK